MPNNALVTGPPRSGKTTVVQTVVDRLEREEYRAGGVFCPEIRGDGDRVGFDIVDVYTDDSRVLAHVDETTGPAIAKYRVNVENVDAVCASAFATAFESADVIVVDEIAPMETFSDEFVTGVRRALDSAVPVVAAIHYLTETGFIGAVNDRDDVERFEVRPETRDRLPDRLVSWVRERLD